MLQSHFVTVEEAQQRLPELLDAMLPGEKLHITQDQQTVAEVVKHAPPARQPRQPGNAIGKLTIVVDDKEHLEHFREYMP